ncbi:MAG TPA: hypothetical protein ENJ62_03335, partial [Bryobacterales bacterium]|nr:hypothetical protein [Bryobacterales bacterium]
MAELLASLAERTGVPPALRARWGEVRLEAEFRDGRLVGQGRLEVIHRHSEPVWLKAPAGMIVRRLWWEGQSEAPVSQVTTTDGTVFWEVDRSGVVRFMWEATPTGSEGAEPDVGAAPAEPDAVAHEVPAKVALRHFAFDLPATGSAELLLKRSAGWRVTAVGRPAAVETLADRGYRIRFPGGPIRLTLRRAPDRTHAPQPVAVLLTYRVLRTSVEWVAECRWDPLRDPASGPLEVTVPARTYLLTATDREGQTLAVTRRTGPADRGRASVVLDPASNRPLALVRFRFLTVRPPGEALVLPLPQFSGCLVRQARAFVQVEQGLSIVRVDGTGWHMVPVEETSEEVVRQIQFVAEGLGTPLKLAVRAERPGAALRIGSHFRVGRQRLRATFQIEWDSREGLHALPLALPRPWRIESVDGEPADAFEVAQPSTSTAPKAATRFLAWWRERGTPGRRVVRIEARRPIVRTFDASLFRSLQIPLGDPAERWVAIEPEPGIELVPQHDFHVRWL